MMDKPKMKCCPMCKGAGKIKEPKGKEPARQRRKSEIANQLRDDGYTIREIMGYMGYKSTTSVQLLLKK